MPDSPEALALLTAVGKALADWSGVELQMCSLFQGVSDLPDLDKSRAIFDGVISFEVRLAILDRAMAFEKTDQVETEMWQRMSARLTKFYKKRHELAHFALMSDGERSAISPFLTLDQWTKGAHRHLDLHQIKERDAKFGEIFNAMGWFIGRAKQRRNIPLSGHEPIDPEPPLVPRLRDLANQILEERQRPPKLPQG